jgi:plastocyanin
VLALALAVTASCGSDGSGPVDDTPTVHMRATTFAPSNILISPGDRVRWVNDEPIQHTITPNNPDQPGVWANVTIEARTDASFEHRFTVAGVYTYRCTLHAGMTGRIEVQQ